MLRLKRSPYVPVHRPQSVTEGPHIQRGTNVL